ncbi:universal stress protein [Okeania sp. SIO2G5]|uniref:universal stress protein n=1 Tax=Okeania sp. SIO2G5 TaxID=2607796 RepID=UPI0013BF1816|nr:universal stress protein [Okeania sp. SIO2G5]NEP76627.1 universal stress protein [Okeania sp. SIO2G5]
MFQRALICTDLEDGLHRLVDFVPNLALSGLTQITFLHTTALLADREIPRPDQEKVDQANEQLSKALDNCPDGVEVKVDIQSGRPVDHIFKAIKTHKPDILILGSENRSQLTEKLFGSTTVELCKRLDIPVMILRPQLISTYTVAELQLRCQDLFRYFLVPYDDSKSAKAMVQRIKELAPNRPQNSLQELLLVWVVDKVTRRSLKDVTQLQIQEAEKKLTEVKADLDELGLNINTLVRQGEGIPEILATGMDYDISGITISSNSFGKLAEWSSPSFAGQLLRQSWHPVIYFPMKK